MTISNRRHEWRIIRPYDLTGASASFGHQAGTGTTLGDILIRHIQAVGDSFRWTARWSAFKQHNRDRATVRCRNQARQLPSAEGYSGASMCFGINRTAVGRRA